MSKKSVFVHQYKQALKRQLRLGQSKHDAKVKKREEFRRENKPYEPIRGIYATGTLKTYDQICNRFVKYVLLHHRDEVKSYADCQPFAKEWLESQDKLSAFTLHTYAAALASSFDVRTHELNFTLPIRERKNIKRNRNDNLSGDYKTKRQRDAYTMLRATGCRRAELLRLRKEDFRRELDDTKNPTGNLEVFKRGKGGIKRWCLVNPKYTEFVTEFLKTAKTYLHAEEERLYEKSDLPTNGIHSTRGMYACDLYLYFEKNNYANGKLYHCRKELAGVSYDKGILEKVSFNLQHTRNNIVINYLWLMHE